MGMITVVASRRIDAAPERVYRCLADMDEHAKILPPAFSGFTVVEGGVGAGTVTTFTVSAGARQRAYRMTVAEPEPGRVLTETDANSSLVTTFTVEPSGSGSQVEITTTWQGAGGIGGIFERLFAPRVMKGVYEDELGRLDAHLRSSPA
ncbi:MAG TPA: SRPBCC family protein [Acidimicrobiales bacterium]|nr:SRPBCC family protein [Acidimicrobiales bacterium]